MNKLLSSWESLCAASRVLRFVDINLRGIGQVMFQDNPLTGALFLAAIAWGSYAAGVPQVALCGVLAIVVATLTAQWLRVDQASLRAGLFGYNGVLVGLALATFIAPGPLLYAYVVLGAAVSVVATLGTANAVKPFGVAALTVPVRARHVAAAARDVRVRRARRHRAAGRERHRAVRTGRGRTRVTVGDFVRGRPGQHFAGVPQGQRRSGVAAARRTGGEFARGGGVRARRRDRSRSPRHICSAPRANSSPPACSASLPC